MNVQEQLVSDLRALGVRPGGVLMVHSSLKSLGRFPGGPAGVIAGLCAALEPKGTLLLPALSYASVGPQQPAFDVKATPACVGALPEFFRQMPGVRRSVHPTHSACGVGPAAARLLGAHHLDTTPCGTHSPFRILPEFGGKILMLGCGLRPNTSMHAVEELAEPPYLLGAPVDYRIILADGTETSMRVRRHNFDGFAQRYDRIEPLLDAGALRTGPVLAATAHLIDAPALWEAGLAALRRDPFFFVEPISGQRQSAGRIAAGRPIELLEPPMDKRGQFGASDLTPPPLPAGAGPSAPGQGLPPAPAASPLREEDYALIRQAVERRQFLARAVRIARSSAFSLVFVAFLAVLWTIYSPTWTNILVTLLLAGTSAVEVIGWGSLRAAAPSAGRLLGTNQLVLLAGIVLYCSVQMLAFSSEQFKSATISPEFRSELKALPDMDKLLDQWAPIATYGFYSLVIALSLGFQGGLAWYYFSRCKHIEGYLRDTPEWVRRVIDAGGLKT